MDRVGTGRPVVFLNGLLGQNEHWFRCLHHIAPGNQCIFVQAPLLEMRGSGCSVAGVTRLVSSLLETLLDRPAIVVGNSLGGHVGIRIAHDHPELVSGLVLVGSSGLFERTFEKAQHAPTYDWLKDKIEDLFFDTSTMLPGMVDQAHGELSRRAAARSLVKLARSAKRDNLTETLRELHSPVLLAWGKQDCVTPPDVALQFHDLLPNSRLHWIDQCGHAPQIERPEALTGAINTFIHDIDAGRSDMGNKQTGDGQMGVA